MFINMWKRFFIKSKKLPLGRWGAGHCYRLVDLANKDCCGITKSFHRDPMYYMTLKEDVIYVKKPR